MRGVAKGIRCTNALTQDNLLLRSCSSSHVISRSIVLASALRSPPESTVISISASVQSVDALAPNALVNCLLTCSLYGCECKSRTCRGSVAFQSSTFPVPDRTSPASRCKWLSATLPRSIILVCLHAWKTFLQFRDASLTSKLRYPGIHHPHPHTNPQTSLCISQEDVPDVVPSDYCPSAAAAAPWEHCPDF